MGGAGGLHGPAVGAAVERRHPYEVPELLALPVEHGLERYLTWLTGEVAG